MAIVKMTIKEYKSWTAGLAKGRALQAATLGLRKAGPRVVALLQRRTDMAPPASENGSRGAVHTGHYRRSWSARPVPRGLGIFNDAPYSDVIERGRRRNRAMPPKEVIVRWAQRKLKLTEREAEAASFPIRRAIAKRGLRGRRVFTDAKEKIQEIVFKSMMREFDRVMGGK